MLRAFITAAATAFALTTQANAAVVIQGNYVRAGISDVGTLGSNGSTPPGLLHQPAGTGVFSPLRDYLVPPAIPHDGFSVNWLGSNGFRHNTNVFPAGAGIPAVSGPTGGGTATSGSPVSATWIGEIPNVMRITHEYELGLNAERIHVRTTIEALNDLRRVTFARSIDPDPDKLEFDSFDTINQRGDGILAASEIVRGLGPSTGLSVALLNRSGNTYDHNTKIGSVLPCCNEDPEAVLLGGGAVHGSSSTADETLNMAWLVGDMDFGDVKVVLYDYVMGERVDDEHRTDTVPAPASVVLFGAALCALAGLRRQSR